MQDVVRLPELIKLYDHLKNERTPFNWLTFYSTDVEYSSRAEAQRSNLWESLAQGTCGTVACVAGWAAAMFPGLMNNCSPEEMCSSKFSEAFGISLADARYICLPSIDNHNFNYERSEALRRLAQVIGEYGGQV